MTAQTVTARPVRILPLGAKLVLLAAAAMAVGTHWWPLRPVRKAVWAAVGDPAYAGPWILFEHLFLNATLPAVFCALAWWALVRARLLAPPMFAVNRGVLVWGLIGGAAAIAASLAVLAVAFPPGTIHWIEPNAWKISGNLVSNFCEELVYRGFVLACLAAVFGFWPAAVLSSAAWGFSHEQYPLTLQLLIVAVGTGFAWLLRKTRSLWTPWTSHMVLDVVMDSLV